MVALPDFHYSFGIFFKMDERAGQGSGRILSPLVEKNNM
jgi:hypothetical protein